MGLQQTALTLKRHFKRYKKVKTQYSSITFKNSIPRYLFLMPAVLFTFVFSYVPLCGIIIAFMDYDPLLFLRSPWVGFKNFEELFQTPAFLEAILHTLQVGFLTWVIGFALSIAFALLLNEVKNMLFKRIVQTVSYLPYFLAWISVVGLATSFLDTYGPLNDLIVLITKNPDARQLFLAKQSMFLPNIIFLHCWKNCGWTSIIFLAAITSIDLQQFEAAAIDGANRFQQLIHVTLPGIAPVIAMMMILSAGTLVSDNFELIYGMQNPFINFEVIGTVIYKQGIGAGRISLATAFGLSQGIVALILSLIVNKISKKTSGIGLF